MAQCKKQFVEQLQKQDLFDFLAWMREQPVPARRNNNPERTYNNKMWHLTSFLKSSGVPASVRLRKSEYPQYEEKMVTAHIDEELDFLYGRADAERRFLLDFGLMGAFKNAMASRQWFASPSRELERS